MSLEVKSTKTLTPSYTVMVYAEAKAGKTRFGSTFPKPIIIACDPGLMSLRELEVDYITPSSWAEWQQLSRQLEMSAKNGKVTVGNKEYESIIVDDLTEFYELIMVGAKKATNELPSQPDYGLARDRFKRQIKMLRGLGVPVLLTALEEMSKDELTGKILIQPMLPGKLSGEIPALVDFYFHAQTRVLRDPKSGKELTEYVLLTERDGLYSAGGREGLTKKLSKFEPNHWPTIYKKLTTPA